MIIPTALVFLLILFTRFQQTSSSNPVNAVANRMTFTRALKHPVIWLFCLMLGLMEVIEFGAANWGGLYLKDVYGLDPRIIGASFVSLFYILFTAARLLGGLVIERVGYLRSLALALIGTAVIFLVGFAAGHGGIWVPTADWIIHWGNVAHRNCGSHALLRR